MEFLLQSAGCSFYQNKKGLHSVNILELVKLFQNLFVCLLLIEAIKFKQRKALNQKNYIKRNPDEKKYKAKENA